jgi:hypothetical protein
MLISAVSTSNGLISSEPRDSYIRVASGPIESKHLNLLQLPPSRSRLVHNLQIAFVSPGVAAGVRISSHEHPLRLLQLSPHQGLRALRAPRYRRLSRELSAEDSRLRFPSDRALRDQPSSSIPARAGCHIRSPVRLSCRSQAMKTAHNRHLRPEGRRVRAVGLKRDAD